MFTAAYQRRSARGPGSAGQSSRCGGGRGGGAKLSNCANVSWSWTVQWCSGSAMATRAVRTIQTTRIQLDAKSTATVVTAGLVDLPGSTVAAKRDFLRERDELRQFVLSDGDLFGVIMTGTELADVGCIVVEESPIPYPDILDHAIRAVTMTVLHSRSHGSKLFEPAVPHAAATVAVGHGGGDRAKRTRSLSLELPCGIVNASAKFDHAGRCVRMSYKLPTLAYVEKMGLEIEIDNRKINVDIAMSGHRIIIVEAGSCELEVDPLETDNMVSLALVIAAAVNAAIGSSDADGPMSRWASASGIERVMFVQIDWASTGGPFSRALKESWMHLVMVCVCGGRLLTSLTLPSQTAP